MRQVPCIVMVGEGRPSTTSAQPSKSWTGDIEVNGEDRTMLRSQNRILTTHAGSLPRPAPLTHLYVQRARGETVDQAALETAGQAALRWVVPKQIQAGIDIGNNGEQQREAFFFYVQHRMSGF